jgi:hypothetical protein
MVSHRAWIGLHSLLRWRWLLAVAATAAVALITADRRPSGWMPARTILLPAHRYPDDCAGEPSLPPLLQVERDTRDPQRLHVHVLPGVDAKARLVVETDQPVQWDDGRAPSALKLRRGDAPKHFSMRAPLTDKSRPHRVRVGLVIEDEQGRPSLTVHEAVDLGPAKPESAKRTSVEVNGTNSLGLPVTASVPADAPTPVSKEAGR